MSRKTKGKPYWEMNLKELEEATAIFDQEFIADQARPLGSAMRARWEAAKAKAARLEASNGQESVTVQLDQQLLARCTALAKKKRISRDALIARGIKAVLAAEGE